MHHPVDFNAITAAAQRLAGVALRTPLLESPLLNEKIGFRLLVKPECLQRTGSFKFRGAYNAISQIAQTGQGAAVVAFSSGNHAQGVAAAARMLGVAATIVMPSDAPRIKLANTRAWGAQVVPFDRLREDRDAIGARIAGETGAALVKPYDNEAVIAGQGTVGLEIAEQCRELGIAPDAVVAPCGGGGLSAGVAIALHHEQPDTAFWTAEPEGWDDTARSLAAGERLAVDGRTATICDALLPPMPGELTFPILNELATGGLVADDAAVMSAMATAFSHFKLVVEPGGAAALAAVLEGKLDCAGRTVVCICSGGNADPALFAKALGAAQTT